MALKFYFIFFFMLCSSLGHTQLLSYQVFKSKKEIGTMTVSRVRSLSEVTYENITEVRYRILIELQIKYLLQETFEEGILMRGHGFSSLNGSKKTTYDIVKKEGNYVLRSEEIPQRIPLDTIVYSAGKIHFQEPRDQQAVFSQHFATYLNFEEIKPHYYLLTSPQGENYYRYENGICTEVTVIRDFGTLYFNLMPESYVIVNTPDSLRNK